MKKREQMTIVIISGKRFKLNQKASDNIITTKKKSEMLKTLK